MSVAGAPIYTSALVVQGPNMSTWASGSWAAGIDTTITAGVQGQVARGTWSLAFDGRNISSLSGTGYKAYAGNTRMTVYYEQ
jgi:hypothetical protein